MFKALAFLPKGRAGYKQAHFSSDAAIDCSDICLLAARASKRMSMPAGGIRPGLEEQDDKTIRNQV